MKCWRRVFNMHELAICQSLMNQVMSIADERNAQSVSSIIVAVGLLSGVEAPLLKTAFTISSAGTIAENAKLIIDEIPIRVKCNKCQSESDVSPNKLLCTQCGDWQTTLISGDELILMSVDLEKSDALDDDLASHAVH